MTDKVYLQRRRTWLQPPGRRRVDAGAAPQSHVRQAVSGRPNRSPHPAPVYVMNHQISASCYYCNHRPGQDNNGYWRPACIDPGQITPDYADHRYCHGMAIFPETTGTGWPFIYYECGRSKHQFMVEMTDTVA